MALREHTRTRLTLVVSGPTPAALTAILKVAPHHHIDTLDSTRRHLADDLQMTPAPPDRYRWWQPAPFPAPHDEPWYELPPRPRRPAPPARGTPHARPTTADRVLPTTTPLPALADPGYPAAGHEPVAQRIHTRIAHPLHAAAVAARVLTGYDTGQLSQVTIPTPQRSRADLPPPLPPWALPLQDAARIYCELQGHIRPDLPAHLTGADRPFRLAPWDENDVEQATHTCGLIPAPTRQRSSRKSRS
ncbi:hypothetical protein [Streptomyces albidoflavus]|uniref:hypothetical protein n=1 Tax=Streptomyces albidoflavus TaxID=1886 RepID=UPI003D0E2AA4